MSEEPPVVPSPEDPSSLFDDESPEKGTMSFDTPIEKSITYDEKGRLKATIPLTEEDVDPFDHSAEQQAIREGEKEAGVAPPELPETRLLPVMNPALQEDPGDPIRDEIDKRFRGEYDQINVEVTDEDKNAFVRATLHDNELAFRVVLEGLDIEVDVAMPTEAFTASAAAAASFWASSGFNEEGNDMQWLLSFQQMHVWYQVRTINGAPTKWSSHFADGVPSLSKLRAFIGNPDNFEEFFQMSTTRWKLLVQALRVAEYKLKICLQNWQNRSFFTTAGTA